MLIDHKDITLSSIDVRTHLRQKESWYNTIYGVVIFHTISSCESVRNRKDYMSKRSSDYNTTYLVNSCQDLFIKNKTTFNYAQYIISNSTTMLCEKGLKPILIEGLMMDKWCKRGDVYIFPRKWTWYWLQMKIIADTFIV